jgi:hypothetical protein
LKKATAVFAVVAFWFCGVLEPVRTGEMIMALEKKSLDREKAASSTPTRKTQKTKAKVDTSKPAASKVVSAMRVLPG